MGNESMMITGDMNIVNIDFFVEWKISDPVKYLFTTENPTAVLKNMLQNLNVREVAWLKRELREIVGRGSSVLLLENESKVCVDVADRLEVIA